MIGKTIGRYQIRERLGAGGMGEVYRAEDTDLKRDIALKFLSAGYGRDDEARARFRREAQALAALNHQNIVTVHEVSEYEGRPFIAMELVEGRTLKEIIAEGVVDPEQVINIAVQIGDGLESAHQGGIVHRDIKSDNIIITADGRAKITDFGLAIWRGAAEVTQDGSTVGTMSYMSPEQAQGQPTDHRSDLWSLGIVIYEMLTGQVPFGGGHPAAVAYAIIQEVPTPLIEKNTQIPPGFQDIIDRALDKDPETRYQSASGMVADLRRLRKTSGSSIRIPITPPPARKRSRAPMTVIAVMALAVMITVALRPWEMFSGRSSEADAAANRIAILYFDNIADPTDPERFGEIATNLLISELSDAEALNVLSSQRLYDLLKMLGREGARTVDRETASQVATRSGARWMLTGSILRTAPAFLLTAELADVTSGEILASPRVAGQSGDDIFTVIDRLTQEILRELDLSEAAASLAVSQSGQRPTLSTDAYRDYLEATELLRQYQYDQAAEKYRAAVAIDSSFALAWYGLSFCSGIATREVRAAIQNAVAYSDKVSEPDRLRILAQAALVREKPDSAIAILEELTRLSPDDKQAYGRLGHIYNGWPFRDTRRAIANFEKVVAIDPTHRDAYNSLGYCYERIGELDKAILAVNKYVELAPAEPNPYDSRAELYGFGGKLDEAIASYEKALEIDSTYDASVSGLVRMYTFAGRINDAEAILQKRAAHPNRGIRSQARWMRVSVALYQGRLAEARKRAQLAFDTDSVEYGGQFSAWWRLDRIAQLYAVSGELLDDESWYDSARTYLTRTLEAVESSDAISANGRATAYGDCSRALALMGDDTEAERLLNRALELLDTTIYGEAFLAHVYRAHLAHERGDTKNALSYYERTIPHEPSSGNSAFLGYLYLTDRQYGEAVETLEFATRRFDQSRFNASTITVRAHYWLAQAYEASGWTDKATAAYQRFLDIWKDADDGIRIVEDARARLAAL